MKNSIKPKTWVRVVNGLAALALLIAVLVIFAPVLRVLHLHRADLGYQGVWIQGYAKRITSVTPGGAADRAGLKAGDVLEFDPKRAEDWILASYREMPEGFNGTISVRRPDGRRTAVTVSPERVALLPSSTDRVATVVRLASALVILTLALLIVWLRPSVMAWAFLAWIIGGTPWVHFATYFFAFVATNEFSLLSIVPPLFAAVLMFVVPFAAIVPRTSRPEWRWWTWVTGLTLFLCWEVYLCHALYLKPFGRAAFPQGPMSVWAMVTFGVFAGSIAALFWNYRRSDEMQRARQRWGLIGMCAALAIYGTYSVQFVARYAVSESISASALTPGQWIFAFTNLVIWPASFGYSLLRERIIDVQFAISRTLVYGVVSTIVLVFLAVLHWLLGRMIEHSGFAVGVEGLAAVGLGFVLHRASHGINTTVDRVLFRKHHAAEERLRKVTVALPFASTEQSIAQAIVIEPTRNLELASAALFYRESSKGPLKRVLAVGWGEGHATTLDAESLPVRYLQAEHTALRLDGEQEWLPAGMPEGSAHPVLAIPIVTQHVLMAVVLYGAHVNSTLPDPDEVALLEALAKAAAVSHQQVRIAMLAREKEAAEREKAAVESEAEARLVRIEEQERTIARLERLAQVRLSGPQGAGMP
jgi:hypothetical protein